jgi:hypothetical protein
VSASDSFSSSSWGILQVKEKEPLQQQVHTVHLQ